VEIIGRRDPGHAAPEVPARPDSVHRRGVARDLLASAAALVVVAALLAGGHFVTRATPAGGAPSDVFVATQLRDLRKVLELYERENGSYPVRLEQLVEDRWLSAREIEVPGHRLRYRREGAGANYRLELDRGR